jgi:hypothetical protein
VSGLRLPRQRARLPNDVARLTKDGAQRREQAAATFDVPLVLRCGSEDKLVASNRRLVAGR